MMTPSAQVQLLTFADVPKEVFTRWDITEHQVNQHLLNESLTGTPEIVADLFTFPPGFIHHMHRHPHADMIVVPRHNWHEFRNISDAPSRVLHFFSGVGAIDDIGYEAHPNQFSITY